MGSDSSLIKGAAVVFGAAAVGLALGIAFESFGRRNGRPGMASAALRTLKQVVAGFALGSITAATFATIAENGEEKTHDGQ